MESNQSGNPPLDESRLRLQCEEIERKAADLLLKGVDWAEFFRVVLGKNGLVARSFSSAAELDWFTDSESYLRLHEMWSALRHAQEGKRAVSEPLIVLTVRIPKSLHESLIEEAHRLQTSVNKLCVAKLARAVPARFVPKLPQFRERTWSVEKDADEIHVTG